MRVALSQADLTVSPVAASGPIGRLVKMEPGRSTRRLNVLLVEDDDADVYLIRRALTQIAGIGEVKVARDGVAALLIVDNWSEGPDLAIVDLNMPRKDGFALLRELSARKSVAFPSVVLTSSKSGADAYRAKKRGAAKFVTKPNSAEKWLVSLREIVAQI